MPKNREATLTGTNYWQNCWKVKSIDSSSFEVDNRLLIELHIFREKKKWKSGRTESGRGGKESDREREREREKERREGEMWNKARQKDKTQNGVINN
jgi:hypothetical protein